MVEIFGYSVAKISDTLNGKAPVTAPMLHVLRHQYGVSTEWMLSEPSEDVSGERVRFVSDQERRQAEQPRILSPLDRLDLLDEQSRAIREALQKMIGVQEPASQPKPRGRMAEIIATGVEIIKDVDDELYEKRPDRRQKMKD